MLFAGSFIRYNDVEDSGTALKFQPLVDYKPIVVCILNAGLSLGRKQFEFSKRLAS